MNTIHHFFSTSILFIAFLSTGMNISAQDINSQNRDIYLKILNKKGRPVKNVVVESLNTGQAFISDRSGLIVFKDMTDDDSLSVLLAMNGRVIIPVTGLDSIVIKAISATFYSYTGQQGQNVIVTKSPLSTDDHTFLDVPAILKKTSYGTLVELLRGEVPGINVSPTGTNVTYNVSLPDNPIVSPNRGPTSINSGTEPLVILDGVSLGTFSAANSMVNIHSIISIEIQKNASGYGVRGANGAIVIKTQ